MAIEGIAVAAVGKELVGSAAIEAAKQVAQKAATEIASKCVEMQGVNPAAKGVEMQNANLELQTMQDGFRVGEMTQPGSDELLASRAEQEVNCKEIKQEMGDAPEVKVDKIEEIKSDVKEYLEDVKAKSPCPETVNDTPWDIEKGKIPSVEENKLKRAEFDEIKSDLISGWEKRNNRQWPRYEQDYYSENGHKIRQIGNRYDAHHIRPLSLGGENSVENITPLHARDHYDHQGVHSLSSSYAKLMKEV